MQYQYHDGAPVVGAPFTASLADGTVRTGNLDGTGYLHLEDISAGPVEVRFDPDARNYQQKGNPINQRFSDSLLREADMAALIAKHNGGGE
jgi:type VI secretion system secreted protein VgrG